MTNRMSDEEYNRLASALLETDSVPETRKQVPPIGAQTPASVRKFDEQGTEIVSQQEAWRRDLASLQKRLETAKAAVRETVYRKQATIHASRMRMKRTTDDAARMTEYALIQQTVNEIASMRQAARVKLAPLRNKIRALQIMLRAYPDG